MVKFLVKLFGGKIAGKAAAWISAMVALGVVQVLGYLSAHGFGWLVSGWNPQIITHVILTAFVGAAINHFGNAAASKDCDLGAVGVIAEKIATDLGKSPTN